MAAPLLDASFEILQLSFGANPCSFCGLPRIVAEYGKPMKVVATGGLAPLFSDVTEVIQAVEPDLTLLGLIEINRRNPR